MYNLCKNVYFDFISLDLGVITTDQIQFFSNKVVVNTAADRLKDMIAVTYDPIKKDVYVSDSNQKIGSIFRIKTTGENANSVVEPIVASTFIYTQVPSADFSYLLDHFWSFVSIVCTYLICIILFYFLFPYRTIQKRTRDGV